MIPLLIVEGSGCLPDGIENRIDRVTESGCWIWIGGVSKNGYGGVVHKGRCEGAHRMLWRIYNGPIPKGLYVLHKCDIKSCVNPDHLFLGSASDNLWDASVKGRLVHGEEHADAKLTSQMVVEMRNVYNVGGTSYQVLADIYGVDQCTIGRVITRKTWKHI